MFGDWMTATSMTDRLDQKERERLLENNSASLDNGNRFNKTSAVPTASSSCSSSWSSTATAAAAAAIAGSHALKDFIVVFMYHVSKLLIVAGVLLFYYFVRLIS